jgi:hypothetical protein
MSLPICCSALRGLAAAVFAGGFVFAAAAQTRVPPQRTQPTADRLLDSAGLSRAVTVLESSDRVTAVTIGRSAGGRPIQMIVITAPGYPLDELKRRARRAAGPIVSYTSMAAATVEDTATEAASPSTRRPVLFAGASWGHEASQVEGLLAAARHLATDRSPATQRILERLVVLIVPLMNPDGRDRAIAEWSRTPLSNGDSAVGNENGFMLNRDFVHQTQPESQAMLKITREWRPVLGIDLHEDVNRLGLDVPEVAFVPPFMPGFDVEEDPATRKAIVAVGAAIASRWRDAGYSVVHDPEGDRTWVPMPPRGSGQLNPVAGSSGRLEFLWTIHGITGLITESARTPGTQTWEARVDQKKLAALAAAEAVATDSAFFARVVQTRRTVRPRRPSPFLVVPHAQPVGADRMEFIRLLREHDVLVYRVNGEPVDLIPLDQPEAPFVRHAVVAERSKLNDLSSAMGVTVVLSDSLAATDRVRLAAVPITLYDTSSLAWPRPRNTTAVAVYVGQGVDRAAAGEVGFVLRMAGYAVTTVDADDVRRGAFGAASAIVFGDGAAREIVDGWDLSIPTRRPPWQAAEHSRGIGTEGVRALRRFVENGGRAITIGRSAGLVAPSLVDVELPDLRPGIGEVALEITGAGRLLFEGVPSNSVHARAFMYAPPGGHDGGYVLKPARSGDVAAWYAGADERVAEQSFADVTPLARGRRNAAIVSAAVGRGHVVLFGFSPVFRAQWRATFALLFNAVNG